MFIDWKPQYYKDINYSQINLQSYCNLSQNPSILLSVEIDKPILKCTEKHKESGIVKTILKNKVGGLHY